MRWEGFKTLLLTLFVLLSLVLTWNLWTFQSSSNRLTKPTFSEISPKGKRTITQVVRPKQAVFRQDGELFGTVSATDLTKMFEMVTNAEFNKVQICGNHLTSEKINRCQPASSSDNSVEMIFPTSIPISLFGNIVEQNAKSQANTSYLQFTSQNSLVFNHIVFDRTSSGKTPQLTAYFMDRKNPVAEANIGNLSLKNLKALLRGREPFLKEISHGRVFYIPSQPKPEKLRYNFNLIDAYRFEKALFSNQNVLIHKDNYFATTNQTLTISNDHIFKFVSNEQSGGQTKNAAVSGTPSDIVNGFNYVNSHSGWTDAYMLFDYGRSKKQDSGTVVFRLMMSKGSSTYPVFDNVSEPFSYNDAGTIVLKLTTGNIYQYMRSMMDLTNRTPYLAHVQFPTGQEVWQQLTTSKRVLMKNVQDLCVGYKMNVSSQDTAMFIPHWYVLYNGNWMTVDELTMVNKTGHEGAAP